MQKILVIDDDREMSLLLKRFLTGRGFNVSLAYNSKQALELLELTAPDLVLCDFRLDNNDGKTMLLRIKEVNPHLPIVIVTGYSDIRIAVEVMKLGACDYVTKPIFPDEIILTISNALNKATKKHAKAREIYAGAGVDQQPAYFTGDGIGEFNPVNESAAQRKIDEEVQRVAPTDANVVIYGESGSGKEVIAQQIHNRSNRHQKPFVAVDCAALSKQLVASELFGHDKGAFTGASHHKTGNFELANGGTLFLNEIANLSYDIQVSLLRVLNERRMRRVGGLKDIALDIRIIIASNEKLGEASARGKFREDLYHRFNEFTITVPPLRERKEDIMTFANHFLHLTNAELGKNVKGFSPEVEGIFTNYIWYGNLRELKNVIKRAALLTDGAYIEDRSLPFEISNFSKLLFERLPAESITSNITTPVSTYSTPRTVFHETTLKEVSIDAEHEMILEALKHTNFNKSKAARHLNIDRKTLYNKMKQYQQLNNQ